MLTRTLRPSPSFEKENLDPRTVRKPVTLCPDYTDVWVPLTTEACFILRELANIKLSRGPPSRTLVPTHTSAQLCALAASGLCCVARSGKPHDAPT